MPRPLLLAALLTLTTTQTACVHQLARKVIFPGSWLKPYVPYTVDMHKAQPPSVQTWLLDTDEGTVHAFYKPAPDASPDNPAPLLIYCHGTWWYIEYLDMDDEPFTPAGMNLLCIEYRGYGNAQGTPSRQHFVADALAFYDRAASLPEVDADRIVLYGQSMGTGVVAEVATQRPTAALILENAYTSVRDVAARFVPRCWVPPDANLYVTDHLKDYTPPVLLSHGLNDFLIPPTQAETNYRAIPHAILILQNVGHTEFPTEALREEQFHFLRHHGLIDAMPHPDDTLEPQK